MGSTGCDAVPKTSSSFVYLIVRLLYLERKLTVIGGIYLSHHSF